MSVIEILTRVEAICQKYDRYDVEKQKDLNVSGDDAFARLYASVDADIEALLQVPLSLSLSFSIFTPRDLCLVPEKPRENSRG